MNTIFNTAGFIETPGFLPGSEAEVLYERKLIKAAQQDITHFRSLYLLWVQPIYKYCLVRTGQVHLAEDITSQVFLKAMENLNSFQARGRFAAWLFTIARNQIITHFRKCKCQPVALDLSLYEETIFAVDDDPYLEVVNKEYHEKMLALIGQLPDEEQEIIRLRYVGKLTFKEIAGILGKRENAVFKSHSRLMTKLYRLMEDKNG